MGEFKTPNKEFHSSLLLQQASYPMVRVGPCTTSGTRLSKGYYKITKILVRDTIFEFLNGLNKEFEQTRSFILSKEPLPSLREVFSTILSEENRRGMMMGSENNEGSILQTNQ